MSATAATAVLLVLVVGALTLLLAVFLIARDIVRKRRERRTKT